MNKDFDELIGDAIHICKDHDKASPAMFQRMLSLDFNTALKVFKELVTLGIVPEYEPDEFDEDGDNFIGKIDKEKLKEFLTN